MQIEIWPFIALNRQAEQILGASPAISAFLSWSWGWSGPPSLLQDYGAVIVAYAPDHCMNFDIRTIPPYHMNISSWSVPVPGHYETLVLPPMYGDWRVPGTVRSNHHMNANCGDRGISCEVRSKEEGSCYDCCLQLSQESLMYVHWGIVPPDERWCNLCISLAVKFEFSAGALLRVLRSAFSSTAA